MLYFRNKKIAFNPKRCTQCGACLAACPNDALKSNFDENSGLSSMYAHDSCIRCGKCVAVCPAHSLPLAVKAEELFPAGVQAWLSRNSDKNIAFSSSSGGAVRTIVKACLDNGLAEEAYMVLADKKYPWAVGRFIQSGDEAMQASTSMYLPVMGARNLGKAKGGASILLVGLPCQLMAACKLLKERYKKILTISIFCKQQKTLGATRYYCKRVGSDFSLDGPPMQFRGTGWPGVVRKGEFELLHTKFCVLPFGFPIWRVPGCNSCNMPFGYNTDISVADPWGIDDEHDTFNTPGNSLVMVRSKAGQKMFKAAASSLVSSPIQDLALVKASVDLSGIIRKHELAPAYAGKNTAWLFRFTMLVEIAQNRVLEAFLKYAKLNEKLYWATGKQPQLARLVYKIAKIFVKKG